MPGGLAGSVGEGEYLEKGIQVAACKGFAGQETGVLPQPYLGGGNHSQARLSRTGRSREGRNDRPFNAVHR
jgi:hypothetical protein